MVLFAPQTRENIHPNRETVRQLFEQGDQYKALVLSALDMRAERGFYDQELHDGLSRWQKQQSGSKSKFSQDVERLLQKMRPVSY